MRSPPAASAVRLDMETGKIYYESQSRPSSLKLQRQQSKAARRPRSAQRDKTRGLPEAAKTTGHGATSSRSPPPPRWLSLSNVRHAPSSEERWTASSAAEQERRVWRTLLGNFVASPAIGDAQRALTKWLRREPPWLAAAAVAHEAARLAFHEDVVLLRCGTAAAAEGFSRQSLEVTVGLGLVDHRAGVGSIAVRCGGAETVRGLVVAATTKYAQIFGDAERFAGLDVDNCIFKVVGRAEYLIHGAWRLADYRCVANARHDRRRLKLELLELDARAKAALANVRALSTDDFNLLTHRARSPKGDYYSHHLPPSRKKKTKKTKHVVAGVALGVSVTADRSVSDRGTKLAGYLARRLAEHRDDMERIWSAIDDHQLFDDDDDDDLDDDEDDLDDDLEDDDDDDDEHRHLGGGLKGDSLDDDDEEDAAGSIGDSFSFGTALSLSSSPEAVGFRVAVRKLVLSKAAVRRLAEQSHGPPEVVWVELIVLDAGGARRDETATGGLRASVATRRVDLSSGVARWSQAALEHPALCPDCRSAPRSCRLILRVRGSAGNDKKFDVAVVTLPWIGDDLRLRRGEARLQLWPMGDVVVDSTATSSTSTPPPPPSAAGSQDDAVPSTPTSAGVASTSSHHPPTSSKGAPAREEYLGRGVVGENPAADFASVTVVFETDADLVADDAPDLDTSLEAAAAFVASDRASRASRAAKEAASKETTAAADLEEERDSSGLADNEADWRPSQGTSTLATTPRTADDSHNAPLSFSSSEDVDLGAKEKPRPKRLRRPSLQQFFGLSLPGGQGPLPTGPSSSTAATPGAPGPTTTQGESSDSTEPATPPGGGAARARRLTESALEMIRQTANKLNPPKLRGGGDPASSSPPSSPRRPRMTLPTYGEIRGSEFVFDDAGLGKSTVLRSGRETRRALVASVARRQPLYTLSEEEREALWRERDYAATFPALLPMWWLAVPRHDRAALTEARSFLGRWGGAFTTTTEGGEGSDVERKDALSTQTRVALELLGYRHTDAVAREFACRCLDELPDDHFGTLLLQLVQCLKLELRHDSPLARLLVRRGACAPRAVGHRLFWLLRSELQTPAVADRFGVVLSTFLAACGPSFREDLATECYVDAVLADVGRRLKWETLKTARHRLRKLLEQANDDLRTHARIRLRRLLVSHHHHHQGDDAPASSAPQAGEEPRPRSGASPPQTTPTSKRFSFDFQVFHNTRSRAFRGLQHSTTTTTRGGGDLANLAHGSMAAQLTGFTTCLDPSLRCVGVDVAKCRVLSSKKQPLLVVLKNADPDGDDFHVIYKHGDDLRQDQLTLQLLRLMDDLWRRHSLNLEMNPYRCVATAADQGFIEVVRDAWTTADIQVKFGKGAKGAFKDNVVLAYLRAHNLDAPSFQRARAAFVSSCSGYCVATYVLGVGDRHADNIMVTTAGRLVHIDFGHFLGNFKVKFGIKRERSPFVFTPDMRHVMITDDVAGSSSSSHNRTHFFWVCGSSSSTSSSSKGKKKTNQERSATSLFSPTSSSSSSSSSLTTKADYGRQGSDATPRLGYGDFENFCCDAYNAVRDRAGLFVVLFLLMLPAGMPELLEVDDVDYMIDQLALDLSPEEAAGKFRNEIKAAHRDIWRRVDNYLHNRRHAPKRHH